MGEYSDYQPADYAEVSSFKRTPSEYSGTRSPAPYATTTLIGSSKMMTTTNSGTKFVFCPSNQIDSNSYGRNVYSESYFNPNEKDHNECRQINTMSPNQFCNQNAIKLEPIKRNRLNLMRPNNNFKVGNPHDQQLYIKVGEIVKPQNPSNSSHSTLQSVQSGSLHNWNNQNFNIYENHLHDHIVNTQTQNPNDTDKEYVFVNSKNVITYINSNEYPENI